MLLFALWLIWIRAAWLTSRFDPEQPVIQVVIVRVVFGTMIMAVALPGAFGHRSVAFAATYVAIQLGMLLLVMRTGRHGPRQPGEAPSATSMAAAVSRCRRCELLAHRLGGYLPARLCLYRLPTR